MDERELTRLLHGVKSGKTKVQDAVTRLKDLPFAELGYATLDTHRNLRFGFPEVVLGEPKTVEQCLGIVQALSERGQSVLVTRLQPDKAEALLARCRGVAIPMAPGVDSLNVAVAAALALHHLTFVAS